jgi:RimJ/RimL family protein N-acetyltransferase
MRYFRKIVGERLYLSPFDADDAEIYTKWAEWLNDKAVSEHYGGHHNLISTASAKKTLEELKGYRFAIVLLDGDVLIGHISLHNIDHVYRNAFLGVFIGEAAHRNRGYGAEAIRLALDYGFKTLNLHNVMLSVHADNCAAIACYEKVGFREVGRRREGVFKDGKYLDKIFMDILARQWIAPPG